MRSINVNREIAESKFNRFHGLILFWCSIVIIFDGFDLVLYSYEVYILNIYKDIYGEVLLDKPEEVESMRIGVTAEAFSKLDGYVKEINTKGITRTALMRDVVLQLIGKLSKTDARKLIAEKRLQNALREYENTFGNDVIKGTARKVQRGWEGVKTMNRERLDRVMNSLFPLIFCGIVFSIIKNVYPIPLFEMYVYSSFPAGWYFLSMRKKRQMTDTEIIVREIRRLKYDDGLIDLAFFVIIKGIKLCFSLVIVFFLVPYYIFGVIWGLYKIINSKIMKQDKSKGEEL